MGNTRKVIGRIEFNDEQKKKLKELLGKDAPAAEIVEFTGEDAHKLGPGILKATGVVMCW
jgi:hypothetical protein